MGSDPECKGYVIINNLGNMKSQRQLQIGENIKRVMSEIFMRGGILTIPGSYLTILEADVSPDAKNVKIFLDIFGKEETHEAIIAELNAAAPQFRHELAKKVTLRVVPDVKFVLDKTSKQVKTIEDLLNDESKNFK